MSTVIHTIDGREWIVDLDEEQVLRRIQSIPTTESGKWLRFEADEGAQIIYLQREKIVGVEIKERA